MGEVYKDGIVFLPVHYSKVYLEWAPRNTQKGLVNIHRTSAVMDTAVKNEKGQPILPNGNQIQETAQFFGLNLSAGGRPTFIPMASTQLKNARKWLTLATSERLTNVKGDEFQPPLFYRTYNLTVATDSNSQGSWGTWNVERGTALPDLSVDDGYNWKSLKDTAVQFQAQLAAGEKSADMSEEEREIGRAHV